LPHPEQIETAEQRRERLIEALAGHHGSWAKALTLRRRIADTVIESDRAAGCDPEALRAEIERLTEENSSYGTFLDCLGDDLMCMANSDDVHAAIASLKSERDEARAEVERLTTAWRDAGTPRSDKAEAERDDLAARLAGLAEAARIAQGHMHQGERYADDRATVDTALRALRTLTGEADHG
jgi:hypothetical protein